MKLLLQAGHSSVFPPFVPNGGGAPGEAAWTAQTARALQKRLAGFGVTCDLIGSWLSYVGGVWVQSAAPTEVAGDYDLALFLHYDADLSATRPGYNSGWFWDRWQFDTAAEAADRFGGILEGVYTNWTGIAFHPERRNANTSLYYAEPAIVKAPAVLIECGVGQGIDHETLFTTTLPVEALAEAVCLYLGLPFQQDPGALPETPGESPVEASLRLANWQKHEMEAYIRDGAHRASVDEAAAQEGNAPIDLLLRWAQDNFAAGEVAP